MRGRTMQYMLALLFCLAHTATVNADFVRGLSRLWDVITGREEHDVTVPNIKRTIVTCGNTARFGMNSVITHAIEQVALKQEIREEASKQDPQKQLINKTIDEAEKAELQILYNRGELYTATEGEICGLDKNQNELCNQLAQTLPNDEKLFPTQCDMIMPTAEATGSYQSHNADSLVTCSIVSEHDKQRIAADKKGDEENLAKEEFLKRGTVTVRVPYPACGEENKIDARNACLFTLDSGEPVQLKPVTCELIPIK